MKNFLKGLLLGGILGVLFAPQAGKDTRRDIRNTLDEWTDDLEDAGEEVKESASSVASSFSSRVDEAITKVRGTVSDAKESIEENYGDANQEITTAEEALNDDFSYTQTASRVTEEGEEPEPERTFVQSHARVVEE